VSPAIFSPAKPGAAVVMMTKIEAQAETDLIIADLEPIHVKGWTDNDELSRISLWFNVDAMAS
jgi:hypothetical protein